MLLEELHVEMVGTAYALEKFLYTLLSQNAQFEPLAKAQFIAGFQLMALAEQPRVEPHQRHRA